MPKVKISEYSATANSNTDVASINIDEGCAPSGINNAIRAVMGHLKDFQQGTNGDPFNGPVNGTLGATTASTAVVTTLNSTDATDASSTTAAAMKTAGGLAVAKKMFVGLDANIYGLTVGRGGAGGAANTAYGASAIPIAPNSGVTAIGSNAGKLFNTASDTGQSTFVGYFAGASCVSGTDNTFIGGSAGTNTTGSKNTAVGSQALQLNTTASNNTAVGYQAGYSNTTGADNTAVGRLAAYTTSTGSFNFAGGVNALYSNTTGSYNVALGKEALLANTTASRNTAVGYQAGYTNSTGQYNTFSGYQAGYLATGSGNTLIGYASGVSITTGTSNTFIGANSSGQGSGEAVTTGSKNTIIGAYSGNQGGLDIRTASNYIVLSDGDGNPRGFYNPSLTTWTLTIANGTGGYTIKDDGLGNLKRETSSARYKDNIRDSEYGLNAVMQLQSRMYETKFGGQTDVGLIAEEVALVIPELTIFNKEQQPDSVSYDKFTSVLIKAIQEQQAIITSQAADIEALKAKVGL